MMLPVKRVLEAAALALFVSGCVAAQPLTPAEALDRYLSGPRNQPAICSESVAAVRIDAALPKLGKRGSMSGFKLVSATGQTVYRGLRFTGDSLVKTAVIARFLATDVRSPERATAVTLDNYAFVYDRTAAYAALTAYVFRLKPRRKREGLFRGELWLEASAARPLRLWGDFVKSPSIFIRDCRFVRDYEPAGPARTLVTAHTRIAGDAVMAVWMQPASCAAAGGLAEQDRATQ